jgi:phosphoglycolate phosphatase
MKYEAVIFDLDGTLLNTLEDIGDSCNHILSANSFPTHDIEKYQFFVGAGAKNLIIKALPPDSREDKTVDRCLTEFRDYYADNCESKTYPYEGIIDLLKEIAKKNIIIAVLTNKPQFHSEKCIKKYLKDINIDIIIGQGNKDNLPPKPDPAGALHIARRFNISAGKILYIGDTAIDMKTARAAGMFPLGVSWGFRPVEELQESGAELIIQRPSEILGCLDL